MNLATALGFLLALSLNFGPVPNASALQTQSAPPGTQSQPATDQPQAKTKPKPKHHKKAPAPDCSNAPATQNSNQGKPTGATSSTEPCAPAKKVVRNGGANEPTIQLLGGTNSDQSAQQRSIDQLRAATEENLKKIAGRQLSPSQQDTVNQIKQFMDQSKTAAASGDLETSQKLAQKAQLLSEELVKP